VSESRSQLERGLFDDLRSRLGAALETMTGAAPVVSGDPVPSPPAGAMLLWRQPLASLPGCVWILAAQADWKAAGSLVLKAAGIEDSDEAEVKSTYFEVTNQALAGLAQALTARLGREIAPSGGESSADPPPSARWADAHVTSGDASFTLVVGIEDRLLDALESALAPAAPSPPSATPPLEATLPAGMPASTAAASSGGGGSSQTFDLLLEVELPVTVSFGRAQIPLKDVLKLTTGSIVELNRAVAEPVEVIVNNCVIARGEVVVVEGNFGVRIQEVVSRQERLRTLQ
jgi:flagellar motor switch protein FliN/FliY